MKKNIGALRKEIRNAADKKKAVLLSRFFKTGVGEYAEGDVFLGIVVPVLRRIAKGYHDLPLEDAERLLRSGIHEERFIALLILMRQFETGGEAEKKKIYALYLKNKRFVNNWDLIDISAPRIIGGYLFDKEKSMLYALAASRSLWDRRIAVIATFYFIRQKKFEETFNIADILLRDTHDLIHKAVGWMLREAGNQNKKAEETFLKERYKRMPRTMLRYAIEKFPESERKAYLAGSI